MPALSPSTLAQIQSRGYSQGNINSWLGDNPDIFEAGDAAKNAQAAAGGWQQANARALASFPAQAQATHAMAGIQASTGGSGGSSNGGSGGGAPSGGTPDPTTPTTGLTPTSLSAGGGVDAASSLNLDALRAQPNGYVAGQPGMLRPFLGQRGLGSDALSLSALQRKAY